MYEQESTDYIENEDELTGSTTSEEEEEEFYKKKRLEFQFLPEMNIVLFLLLVILLLTKEDHLLVL